MFRALKDGTKRAILWGVNSRLGLNAAYQSLCYAHANPSHSEARLSDRARFLGFVAAYEANSQSQLFQDLWVLFETESRRGGFFVEFGALDGRTISNTFLLEDRYGWNGILAEPAPQWRETLARNRKCHISEKCVWTHSGETVAFNVVGDTGYSTISSFSDSDVHADRRKQESREIRADTITLCELLESFDAPKVIDFLSIDTEGSEYDILAAFDFDRYTIAHLCVEHNWTANEQKLDRLLAERGFERRFPEFSQFDGWYRNMRKRS